MTTVGIALPWALWVLLALLLIAMGWAAAFLVVVRHMRSGARRTLVFGKLHPGDTYFEADSIKSARRPLTWGKKP